MDCLTDVLVSGIDVLSVVYLECSIDGLFKMCPNVRYWATICDILYSGVCIEGLFVVYPEGCYPRFVIMYTDVLMYFLLCILECGIEENVCYMSWRTVSYIHSAVLMDCLLCILVVVVVPDKRIRNIPEVILVRRGAVGFWEFGRGGRVG